MKHLLGRLLLIGLLLSGPVAAQAPPLPQDVFLLVDVSGSMVGASYGIGYEKVTEAKNLVRDLLTDRFDQSRYPNWQHSLLAPEILAITSRAPQRRPLLTPGSRLFLKRFGDPQSSKASSILRVINNVQSDVDGLLARFPNASAFKDQRTFLWLARAMTRREALAQGLSAYLLIEITDAREDKESLVDVDDQVAVREFKSLKHVAKNGEIGSFTHRLTQGEYVLQVNLRLIRLANDPGLGSQALDQPLLSNLTLPTNLSEGQDAVISWDSFNAPVGSTYQVTLRSPSGAELPITAPSPPVTFPSLSRGTHTVMVSANGQGPALQGQFDVAASVASIPVPTPDDVGQAGPSEIILQSPRRDAEITSGSVTVSWRVVHPPAGCKYLVTITGPPGTPKIPKKTVDGTRASFSVRKSGPYRVRVAATARGVKPASGTFMVKNQSGKKLLYLLLTLLPIAIVATIGVRHARKRRLGEEDEFDSFSQDLD